MFTQDWSPSTFEHVIDDRTYETNFALSVDRGDFGPPCAVHGSGLVTAGFVGLDDRSRLRATWRRKLLTDRGVKIQLILIETNEGPNSNAVLCIPMTADNGSLAILNSSIHPSVNGSLFKWPGLLHNLAFHKSIRRPWEKEA